MSDFIGGARDRALGCTMRGGSWFKSTIFSVLLSAALACSGAASVRAQQADATKFNQTYETAVAQAHEKCHALWADHAFDPIRDKTPLEGKPTFSMLKNSERLNPKDRPLADLAIKTLEQCRAAYAPVYAMLPPQINRVVHGLEGRQDALIAELYSRKITFGKYNIEFDRMLGELASAFSGIKQSPTASTLAASEKKPAADEAVNVPRSRPTDVNPAPKATISPPHEVRIALVIGESRYLNLPRLINPEKDARSIAETLQKLGYNTQLLLDASEGGIRKEIRKFASESSKADVAVVFYAGHGAQLNGSNYLLPIDIDILHTDADIQFAALKVDDLINSIGSNTKIVFLDACRDNPALFKNLVNGRGGSPVGLAPASASNFNTAKPGGGIFIAYATDAGAVADDGHGQHSPFTQALLSNMQKPISIDDMFSLVTKEVRLVTKNAQRPFKYASLENIICLTPACLGNPAAAAGDIVQQATQSEDEELQIAVQTKNSDALETYLQKYPETKKRSELLDNIAALKRSEVTEWTLYEVANQHLPQYIQLSSIEMFENRASARVRMPVDPSLPKVFNDKPLPDAAYFEATNVYDCAKPAMATADSSIFDNSGKLISHYKWADPQYLNLSIGITLVPGAVGLTAKNIACHVEFATPLISKGQLAEMKFTSLASTPSGDGEIFFGPSQTSQNVPDQKELVSIVRYNSDHNIKDYFPQGVSIPDPPNFRTEVDHVLFKCSENKILIDKGEFWSVARELVRVVVLDRELPFNFSEIKEGTPFATLQEIVCGKSYGGIGVSVAPDSNGSTRVIEVLSGSPAEKVGLKKDDLITHVNGELVSALTPQQVIQKLRGPAHSKVDLTIVRKGQDKALEVAVNREIIERHLTQGTPAK